MWYHELEFFLNNCRELRLLAVIAPSTTKVSGAVGPRYLLELTIFNYIWLTISVQENSLPFCFSRYCVFGKVN